MTRPAVAADTSATQLLGHFNTLMAAVSAERKAVRDTERAIHELEDDSKFAAVVAAEQRAAEKADTARAQLHAALLELQRPAPETVAEQQLRVVGDFINQRPAYIVALEACPDEDTTNRAQWTGQAAARRELAEALGMTVPCRPGDRTEPALALVVPFPNRGASA